MINKLKELRAGGEEEGFTLIELMIVVVIIGILAAIAIPVFANQQKSALVAGVKSDVKNTNTNIATALTKDPTASVVGGATAVSFTTNGADITVGSTTADVVISDAATTIAVAGDWDGYTVTGTNSGLTGSIVYDSAQGKNTTTTLA